ncbi:MAG: lipid IV(A) 3-deoxy-D-manno-octulosonic acid transferase [Alcanivoracaceae bacterium]
MRLLYTLLWWLLMPLMFVRLWWLGARAPAYRGRWRERMGYGYQQRLSECVWVHAVSVGETLAAAPMIEALLQRYPDMPLVVTTTTPTGSERVQALFAGRVIHVYWPWDAPGPVRRFWRAFNPKLVILLETELWPNLVANARRHRVPVVLANGRLSARSHRGYSRLRGLMRPMLQSLDGLAVQTAIEGERFVDLGADPARVTVTGNVKFDIDLDDSLRARAAALREQFRGRPVWIAASTHPGEDEVVLAAHQQLRKRHGEALLVLVPRHQERFDQVAAQVTGCGETLARRSRQDSVGAQTSVYLADTMGELLMLYGAADIAFVGGSLVPVGGHNLLEPALWAKPVITGPVLHNFSLISDLLGAAGAHRLVQNSDELAALLDTLFSHPDQCRQMGERAAQVVEQHRGALASLLTMLARHWPRQAQ